MSLSLIVLVLLVVIVGAFLLERGSRTTPAAPESNQPRSANAAEPTETGKYRVQQMLRSTSVASEPEAKSKEKSVAEEPDSALPDPFESDDTDGRNKL